MDFPAAPGSGSIFDNVIRKLMTPGKVFLYILKVL